MWKLQELNTDDFCRFNEVHSKAGATFHEGIEHIFNKLTRTHLQITPRRSRHSTP